MPLTNPLPSGEMISHYRVVRTLGHGGMGTVYLAEDTRLERLVALKFLIKGHAVDPEAERGLIAEAQTIATIDHPNVCTVFEIGESTDGQVFIATAYYEGVTLEDLVQDAPIDWKEVLDYSVQLASGLGAAHKKKVIHRDVKPGNAILTGDGRVKLLDFGLAFKREQSSSQPAQNAGTIAYMSPEHVRDATIDHRTDIWSLGVMMYEMLTGLRPFEGFYEQAIIYQILNVVEPPFSGFNVDAPPMLLAVVTKCLEKNKDERYDTVDALLADLEEVQAGNGRAGGSVASGKVSANKQQLSIAILPFADLSQNRDQQYFSEGISEDISDMLARVDGWKVLSSASTISLRSDKRSVKEIGELLRVSHILDGSVRTAGNRVRIRSELSAVDDGFQIWSERYDRAMDDIFEIQDDIAEKIVNALNSHHQEITDRTHHVRREVNTDAYRLYLQARSFLDQRSDAGLQRCVELCESALEIDPEYAQVYAALSDCEILKGMHGGAMSPKAWSDATRFAEQALSIDPKISEAHVSLGCLQAIRDRDWKSSEGSFRKAAQLNHGSPSAHHWYAIWNLMPQAKFDEATSVLEFAQSLDPLSPVMTAGIGWCYYFSGDYERALYHLDKTLELHPEFPMALDLSGQTLHQMDRTDEAVDILRRAVQASKGRILSRFALAYVLATDGKTDAAWEIVGGDDARLGKSSLSNYDLALLHVATGDHDRAEKALRAADEERSGWVLFLGVDPRWESFRKNTVYSEVLNNLALD